MGVVELQRLPRLARFGEPVRVARGVERRDGDLVAADVVRVRVAAPLVVGDQHVRAQLADHRDQRPVCSSRSPSAKQPSGSGGSGSPSGNPEST